MQLLLVHLKINTPLTYYSEKKGDDIQVISQEVGVIWLSLEFKLLNPGLVRLVNGSCQLVELDLGTQNSSDFFV